ncbi:antibiotic biosynthesis monooxygenase [Aurantimonas sp. 22II-16-19i]|uniref:putative quinol monooxygenase n=1 Tax=Aurantimonas sp. 22II-16-19i TaxID=1317114 RepID=UPI0009F7D7AD|nr:antibiotic biosynthesis monooxygenase [Aurantimonas sp. 22II-16-19i]ORE98391.1 Antibiotic biosynthesis monooxygenase [Aurantimonas sp. 22II-16-19i]
MIILTGYVHIDPCDVGEFSADVEALARGARARAGCLFYAVAPQDAPAGRMLVAERWRDQSALTAHLEAAETAAFVARWTGRMTADILKFDADNERRLADA